MPNNRIGSNRAPQRHLKHTHVNPMKPWLVLLAALGCQEAPSASQLLEQSPPPTMSLQGPTSVAIGSDVTWDILGGPPGQNVHVVASTSTSNTQSCPAPLAPLCLDLRDPVRVLGRAAFDNQGRARFTFTLPDNTALLGRTIRFQAATNGASGPMISNVAAVQTTDGAVAPAICGNGIVEDTEFCDVGPTGTCDVCVVSNTGNAGSYSFVGEWADDLSGYSVASAGDVDGDGLDDLLIGAPENDEGGSGAGKTYLMLGADIAAAAPGTAFDLSNASYSFIGEQLAESGFSVASAGDVDGDGLDDLLIGAPENRYGRKISLMLGSDIMAAAPGTSFDLSNALYSFAGEAWDHSAGASVASAGDVDGDGLDDLLIGDWEYDTRFTPPNIGKTYLVLGSDFMAAAAPGTSFDLSNASYSFVGERRPYDRSGFSVASAGDVDGDGLDDLLIGAHNHSWAGLNGGKTYLMLGADIAAAAPGTAFDLSNASYSFLGEENDYSGFSVASAGDVDGDGLDDLLIGAHRNSAGAFEAGKTYLMLGSDITAARLRTTFNLSNASYSFVGEEIEDHSGFSVASAGDVDGDGLDDLLIGSNGNDEGGNLAGKTYLMLASEIAAAAPGTVFDLSNASHGFVGEASYDLSGESVASAGDVDGDGKADLLIGAHRNSAGAFEAGKTYLILSPY